VPASGLDSSFNPLAACSRDSLAVEDDQRHFRYCASAVQRFLPSDNRSSTPRPPTAALKLNEFTVNHVLRLSYQKELRKEP
jgi:hypothetical protein